MGISPFLYLNRHITVTKRKPVLRCDGCSLFHNRDVVGSFSASNRTSSGRQGPEDEDPHLAGHWYLLVGDKYQFDRGVV